ncbi:MAG: PilN domain-containing protein [Hydrogenophaga sp.]
MIAINLLPYREMARQRQRKRFWTQLGCAASVGTLVCAAGFVWYQEQLAVQQARNRLLSRELARLDEGIRGAAALRDRLAALRSRQADLQAVQDSRWRPVWLLDELVEHVPEGLRLISLRREGALVSLTGVARTPQRVSELLRKLSREGSHLHSPQLLELVALPPEGSNATEAAGLSSFTMRVSLQTPASPPPASAASVMAVPAAR